MASWRPADCSEQCAHGAVALRVTGRDSENSRACLYMSLYIVYSLCPYMSLYLSMSLCILCVGKVGGVTEERAVTPQWRRLRVALHCSLPLQPPISFAVSTCRRPSAWHRQEERSHLNHRTPSRRGHRGPHALAVTRAPSRAHTAVADQRDGAAAI